MSVNLKNSENLLDDFLASSSANTKSFVVFDRCGLKITFSGLLPITEGDEKQERIWGSSIILNSAQMEFPNVEYKLRALTKRHCKQGLHSNKSHGKIKINDVVVIAYQLPESSIHHSTLILVIDGSPHEVPLFKVYMSDYYWLGKVVASVPTAKQLYNRRKSEGSVKMDTTPEHISPGRFENLPDGMKEFLSKDGGSLSLFKLLIPHAKSIFKDLSELNPLDSNLELLDFSESPNDLIVDEIVRRFHEHNRTQHPITPALLQ